MTPINQICIGINFNLNKNIQISENSEQSNNHVIYIRHPNLATILIIWIKRKNYT